MKAFKIYLILLLALIVSCKNQEAISDDKVQVATVISVKQVTSQISYPGMSDGSNRYKQRWMFQIDNVTKSSGRLSLILKDRKIDIGELEDKGIVIGNDNNDVFITIDITYPIELNYPESDLEISSMPRLLLENEETTQEVILDNVIVLESIIYPSNTN